MMGDESDIYEMIYRIEERIGIIGGVDEGTLTGEMSMMRSMMSPIPHVEVDVPITGDTFSVKHAPVKVGDSAIVNGHAIISLDNGMGVKLIEEWRGIVFNGKTGTISGAGQKYDKKTITLTYYHSPITNNRVTIDNGFISISESNQDEDDIIIKDLVSGDTYELSVSWDKTVFYSKTRKTLPTNDIITDLSTGIDYIIFLKDEVIEYEEV